MEQCQKLIEQTIFDLTRVPVELKQPKTDCWVVIPKDRSLLQSRLWRELRNGPCHGVGSSPIQAAVLLARAVGSTGPRRVSPRYRARSWVEELLADFKPRSVDEIKKKAHAEFIPWSSVDRAARELCILRKKCGFRGCWFWEMPYLPQDF
jgi:hypothetical protein